MLGASFIGVGYTIQQSMGLLLDLWSKMTYTELLRNLILALYHANPQQ